MTAAAGAGWFVGRVGLAASLTIEGLVHGGSFGNHGKRYQLEEGASGLLVNRAIGGSE